MSSSPNLTIERLNLRLPAGFENRAETIARQVGYALANMPGHASLNLDSLTVPPVRVGGGETDAVIARRIARAVHGQIVQTAAGGGNVA